MESTKQSSSYVALLHLPRLRMMVVTSKQRTDDVTDTAMRPAHSPCRKPSSPTYSRRRRGMVGPQECTRVQGVH